MASKGSCINAVWSRYVCIECRIARSISIDAESNLPIEKLAEKKTNLFSSQKVRPKFLECLAVGCLYLAAKCKEEDDQIAITPEFVIDCNANCSSNELLRMERLILEKFDWFVDFVTPVDFLQLVSRHPLIRLEKSDRFDFAVFRIIDD